MQTPQKRHEPLARNVGRTESEKDMSRNFDWKSFNQAKNILISGEEVVGKGISTVKLEVFAILYLLLSVHVEYQLEKSDTDIYHPQGKGCFQEQYIVLI
jgi:hypothetical protein